MQVSIVKSKTQRIRQQNISWGAFDFFLMFTKCFKYFNFDSIQL